MRSSVLFLVALNLGMPSQAATYSPDLKPGFAQPDQTPAADYYLSLAAAHDWSRRPAPPEQPTQVLGRWLQIYLIALLTFLATRSVPSPVRAPQVALAADDRSRTR